MAQNWKKRTYFIAMEYLNLDYILDTAYEFSSKFQRKFPALAAVVMGRNVANVTTIEDFLKSFHTDNQDINKWLDTTLRKYFIRDFDKTKPYQAKHSDPEWMQGKQDLIEINLDEDIHGKVEHLVDFLKAQLAQNPAFKLANFQAAEAFKQSAQWLEQLLKKKIEEEKEGKDFIVLLTEGSFKWVDLISENALAREGRLMGHCVGGYWNQVKTGNAKIFSLRDSKNEPHATIEYDPKTKRIDQIKGKQNRQLNDEYRPTLINFLNSKKVSWKDINEYDAGKNGLLITGDGLVVDRGNIPSGTVLQGPIKNYSGNIKFPDTITIKGDFIVTENQESLPEFRLEVTGNLDLSKSEGYSNLPEELIVKKNFIGSGWNIEKLPKRFLVGGNVFLDGCNLLELPNNLKIKGELDISNNPISELPRGLQVAGELDLMDTAITKLPEDLKVGDAIYVDDEETMQIPEHLKEQVF